MDMIEVERKRSLNIYDLKTLLKVLEGSEFNPKGSFVETDTYFTRMDIDYLETIECLRVRERDGFSEITYKPASTKDTTSSEGITSKKELNVILSDSSQTMAANELLEVVGLLPLVVVRKERTSYSTVSDSNITISIDKIDGAGTFVEVEIMSTDIEKAQSQLEKIEEELDLKDCKIINTPYRDIVLERSKKK